MARILTKQSSSATTATPGLSAEPQIPTLAPPSWSNSQRLSASYWNQVGSHDGTCTFIGTRSFEQRKVQANKYFASYSIFASWDAEEYALIGSTEWVEEHAPWLSATALTYLNVDIGVAGPLPGVGATPELRTLAQDIMKKVEYGKKTLYDAWNELYMFRPENNGFTDLGSGSDYTAFLQLGIGALDFGR